MTPVGTGIDEAWSAALDGESGGGPLTRFDPEGIRLRSRVACEVDGEFTDHEAVDDRSMGRFARFGVVAADEAIGDAGLDPDAESWTPERVGTALASGIGGIPEFEDRSKELADGGRVSPRFIVSFLPNLAAGHLSIEFDAAGPNRAPSTACAAGANAVADAVDDIRLGRADVMIAGGAESGFTPTAVAGFDAMRALSTRNDDPARASRPFDADRDGFVMAEGSGVLILEAREHAERRGATPYAEVAGVGLAGDATHPTRPPDDAHGLRRAMGMAIDDAGVPAVDCVNAHATATPRGDVHEATAIRKTTDGDTLVWAPKGGLGHTLGAAGAIETVLGARAVAEERLPPTVNCENRDGECDVAVTTEPAEVSEPAMACNAAGFGGTNVSLVLTPP